MDAGKKNIKAFQSKDINKLELLPSAVIGQVKIPIKWHLYVLRISC